MKNYKYYFSYGSNLNIHQMSKRCPAARPVVTGVIKDYRLEFNGNFRGNGVLTIKPKKGAVVHGALWEVTRECWRSLDRYEGYPSLYRREVLDVHTESGEVVQAVVYIMNVGEPVTPSTYYYNACAAGFDDFGLPVSALKRALSETAKLERMA